MMSFKLFVSLTTLLITAWATDAQGQELKIVEQNGPRSNRINMVFMAEGYTADQMGKFVTDVNETVAFLFAQEPWSRYRSYFNIYRIETISQESGTDYISTGAHSAYTAQNPNTFFDSGFSMPQIVQNLSLPKSGSDRAFSLLRSRVPEYDIPIMIVNDTRYGGSGGPIAVGTASSLGRQVMEHELGHSFAKLTDEYDVEFSGYPDVEYPNATRVTNPATLSWKAWLTPGVKLTKTLAKDLVPLPEPFPAENPLSAAWDEYTPEYDWWDSTFDFETWEEEVSDPIMNDPTAVGLFQGANYHRVGWFRPHDNALMRNLGRIPGAVSREAIVLTYYSKVGPVDSYAPTALTQKVNGRKTLTFSVAAKVPSMGQALSVVWTKNGSGVPLATGPILTLPSQQLGNGSYTITATVKDATDWVRTDTKNLLSDSVAWKLTLTNQDQEPPTITEGPESAAVGVGAEVDFHVAAVGAGLGDVTYQWFKDGKAIGNATGSVLSIFSAKLTDGGVYRAVASADGVSAEASADLVVYNPQVQSVVAAEGKSTTLSLNVAGPVQGYQWLYSGEAIQAGSTGIGTLGLNKLTVGPLNVNLHSGLYSMRLTTAAGDRSFDTHNLQVFNEAPLLVRAPGESLDAGRVGLFYEGLVEVNTSVPGRPALTFGAKGLPPGLKVDTKTGAISGIPTAAKFDKAGHVIAYSVTLSAGNGKGTRTVTGINLLIHPLPGGSVGTFVAPLARNGPEGDADPHLNGGLGGRLDLTTTSSGSYSGKIVLGTISYPFKGQLISELESETVYSSTETPRKVPLSALSLDFDITGNGIGGGVHGGGDSVEFTGWRNQWTKAVPAEAFKGYHTFRLNVVDGPSGAPAGSGFGSFTIAADGKATVSGRTADGETFTSAGHVGEEGQMMIFSLQKGKPQGSIVGAFGIGEGHVISGDPEALSWWKPESDDPKARVYKDGFEPLKLSMAGGSYAAPVLPLVALDLSAGTDNADLSFTGTSVEGASRPPSTPVDIGVGSKAKPTAPLAAGTTLTINPKLGTFTGKFSLLDEQVPRAVIYQGIILREGGNLMGDGYFLLPDLPAGGGQTPATTPIQSGAVKLTK